MGLEGVSGQVHTDPKAPGDHNTPCANQPTEGPSSFTKYRRYGLSVG